MSVSSVCPSGPLDPMPAHWCRALMGFKYMASLYCTLYSWSRTSEANLRTPSPVPQHCFLWEPILCWEGLFTLLVLKGSFSKRVSHLSFFPATSWKPDSNQMASLTLRCLAHFAPSGDRNVCGLLLRIWWWSSRPRSATRNCPSCSSQQDLGLEQPGRTIHHQVPWLASEGLVSTTLAHWFLRVTLQLLRPLYTYTCISPWRKCAPSKAAWSLGEQNACPKLSSCSPAGDLAASKGRLSVL